MDQIDKALRKLTAKERELVRKILSQVTGKDTETLDIKKLKGREDIFRVRKGTMRVIYRIGKKGDVFILKIDRRREDTYKF